MDLILWRHADAQDGMPDMDRALTDRGRKQAEKVARWLNERLPADSLILVSPAVRAQQTAAALGKPYKTVKSIAPGADAAYVLTAAGWPQASGTVLVVGHQPTLGYVASMVLCGKESDFSLKKGALVWLTNRVRGEEQQPVLKAAITPELV
ncbi:MAG: phosphohistidine phosphatase SixA [Betaproteobacteria bacterium]|nr:phosphohistidine phosphatase SixA [Betaproteobacteria bacterium]